MKSRFIEPYFCFSLSMAGTEKSHFEDGNRIVMPESSLQRLINRDVGFPYFFRVNKYICDDNSSDHTGREDECNFSDHSSDYSFQSKDDLESSPESDPDQKKSHDDEEEEEGEKEDSETQESPDEDEEEEEDDGEEEFQNNNYRFSHCGVSEFTSDDGIVLLPQWLMTNLGFQNGDSILLESVELEKGSFVKLNPLNPNFLKLSNPKAVLETKLRRFACLTPGEIITIVYNNVKYDIHVVETKPSPGISIIETDCEVEFFQPEPEPEPATVLVPATSAVYRKGVEARKTEDKATIKFRAFSGMGRRLDGVEVVREEIASVRKIVLDSKVIRQQESRKETEDEMKKKEKFQAFKGKSRTLFD